jgi:hypothetical protein
MSACSHSTDLTNQALHFFGKISASVSHEINNVIACMSETSGLLVDLTTAAEQGRPLDIQKFKRHSESIFKQSQRGFAIIKRFNQFAHTVDKPLATYCPAQILANLIELSKRLSTVKNVQLDFAPPQKTISFSGNPFMFQHVVFIFIEEALNRVEKNGVIQTSLTNEPARFQVNFIISPVKQIEETYEKINALRAMVIDEIHYPVEIKTNAEPNRIAIQLDFIASSAESELYY